MDTTDADTDPGALPPPPAPPPPPPRLVRSTEDRVLAGVAGGLAAHLGVDPSIVRIAFVLGAFAGGAGVLAYVIAWLIVPEGIPGPGPTTPLPERLRELPTWAQVLGILAAVLVFGGALGLRPAGWGLALIAVAVVLYLDSERREGRERPAGYAAPAPSPPAAQSWPPPSAAAPPSSRGSSWPAATHPTSPPLSPAWPETTPVAEARPEAPSSPLGRIVVALWFLAVGVVALLDRAGAVSISLAGYGALTALMAGAGLLVGAWWGRARGLIALGLLGAVLLASAPLAQVPRYAGVGERAYAPTTPADLEPSYELFLGELVVDLSQLRLPAGTTTLDAGVTAGEVRVVVPADVDVDVRARVRAGDVDLLGQRQSGTGLDVTVDDDLPGIERRLELRIDSGLSAVTVTRAPGGLR